MKNNTKFKKNLRMLWSQIKHNKHVYMTLVTVFLTSDPTVKAQYTITFQ